MVASALLERPPGLATVVTDPGIGSEVRILHGPAAVFAIDGRGPFAGQPPTKVHRPVGKVRILGQGVSQKTARIATARRRAVESSTLLVDRES